MSSYSTTLYGILLAAPVAYLSYRSLNRRSAGQTVAPEPATSQVPVKSIMQAERADLGPPKDDPFTLEQLKAFDGSDPERPIYVAIKGAVFDVSHKRDVYGPGKSYGVFAGKDASKALGKSSLKPEDAVADYSELTQAELNVLNEWHTFFAKRYRIVGRVVDL